jgi:DNA-binding PadR family transcriptional regulator
VKIIYLTKYKTRTGDLNFKGYDTQQIVYHVGLLWKNGYIEGSDAGSQGGKSYLIYSLTMNGHQYLELLKSKAWNTAKGVIHELGVIFAESAIRAAIDKLNL